MGRPHKISERITRRRKVNQLRIMGFNQQEIADKLGVSQATVSRDFAYLNKIWDEATRREQSEARLAQLAEYELLKRIYYEAWEETQNTSHLQGVERMRSKIDQFWGVDAPFKIAPTDPTGQSEYGGGLSDSTRLELIAALVDRARERLSQTDSEQGADSVEAGS